MNNANFPFVASTMRENNSLTSIIVPHEVVMMIGVIRVHMHAVSNMLLVYFLETLLFRGRLVLGYRRMHIIKIDSSAPIVMRLDHSAIGMGVGVNVGFQQVELVHPWAPYQDQHSAGFFERGWYSGTGIRSRLSPNTRGGGRVGAAGVTRLGAIGNHIIPASQ